MKFEINLGKMSMDESSLTFDLSAAELAELTKNETFRTIARRLTSDAAKDVMSKIGHRSRTKESPCSCESVSPTICATKDINEVKDADETLDSSEVKDTVLTIEVDGEDDGTGDEYLARKLKAAYDEVKSLKSYINDTVSGKRDDSDDNILFAIKRIRRINADILSYKAAIAANNGQNTNA